MKTAAAGPQAIENNFTTMLHLNPSCLRHLSIQSLRFETQPDTFSNKFSCLPIVCPIPESKPASNKRSLTSRLEDLIFICRSISFALMRGCKRVLDDPLKKPCCGQKWVLATLLKTLRAAKNEYWWPFSLTFWPLFFFKMSTENPYLAQFEYSGPLRPYP